MESFKFKNDNYLDSKGIVHNKTLLSDLLNNLFNKLKITKITTNAKTYLGTGAKGAYILIVTTGQNDKAVGVYALSKHSWMASYEGQAISQQPDWGTSNYVKCGIDSNGVWVQVPIAGDYTAILL